MRRAMVLSLVAVAMSGMSGAALEVKNSCGKWAHTLGFAGNYGSDEGGTTAERWELPGFEHQLTGTTKFVTVA